jgi:hypothetical protein
LNVISRPKTREELFNLRHASARNVIERIFGVIKKKFRILLIAPQYSLQVQAQLPAALCALHNFIRIHSKDDGDDEYSDEHNEDEGGTFGSDDFDTPTIFAEEDNVKAWRDGFAEDMWVSYQQVREERLRDDARHEEDDGDDYDEDGEDEEA